MDAAVAALLDGTPQLARLHIGVVQRPGPCIVSPALKSSWRLFRPPSSPTRLAAATVHAGRGVRLKVGRLPPISQPRKGGSAPMLVAFCPCHCRLPVAAAAVAMRMVRPVKTLRPTRCPLPSPGWATRRRAGLELLSVEGWAGVLPALSALTSLRELRLLCDKGPFRLRRRDVATLRRLPRLTKSCGCPAACRPPTGPWSGSCRRRGRSWWW